MWSQAIIVATDRKWKITQVDDDYIELESLTQEDWDGEPLDKLMDRETWAKDFIGKGRGFCLDRNDTVYDKFWGDAAE